MPDTTLLSVILIVALALVFDFINGFHDAANSIATVVSTAYSPRCRGLSGQRFLILLPPSPSVQR